MSLNATPWIRPFLKWPGGKYALLAHLEALLPKGVRLAEPFVGAGSVFLNSAYTELWLNDLNADLIALYRTLTSEKEKFIQSLERLFIAKENTREQYYQRRLTFNQSTVLKTRARLFFYLNRHGYNGLCRYNSKGHYNVPFGAYKKPFFPKEALKHCAAIGQRAQFFQEDFRTFMRKIPTGTVVYCDPPYWPLSPTAHFTRYTPSIFTPADQQDLVTEAKRLGRKGSYVIISNHDLPETRALYKGAKIIEVSMSRNLSCVGKSRGKVAELMAIFD